MGSDWNWVVKEKRSYALVVEPAPTATKTVLGHGTEIEATLSLLRAIPRKNDVLKLLSFEFY